MSSFDGRLDAFFRKALLLCIGDEVLQARIGVDVGSVY